MNESTGRLRGALRDLGRVLLWVWHETFGFHDMRCVERDFSSGIELNILECDCGARIEASAGGRVTWSRR